MGEFFRRLTILFRRRKFEQDLEREMKTHQGMLPAGDRSNFGSILRLREDSREAWGWMWVDRLQQDVAHAFRVFRKSPALTAGIIVILALGSGVNSSVFSILNAVVLRSLPYADPGRLYQITCVSSAFVSDAFPRNALDIWQQRTQVFEKMASVHSYQRNLEGLDQPEQLSGLGVTKEFFPLLGTQPLLGRWFSDEDCDPKSPATVIISSTLRDRKFGHDAAILGRPLKLDGRTYTVIGVMPIDFQFRSRDDVFWLPQQHFGGNAIYARIKAGITREQVQAETESVFRLIQQTSGRPNWQWRGIVTPLQDVLYGKFRPALLMLLGAVGVVLMIACLNVSNILLARGHERAKELAVRSVLGADRFRIARQLFTETLVLVSAGGVLGLVMAGWMNKASVSLFSTRTILPRLERASLDARVLGFTVLIVLVTSVVSGLVPAFQSSRFDVSENLKESGGSSMGGIRSRRFRNWLIVAETALSVVLLVGSGLMLRSFDNLSRVDRGFRAENVLTVRLPLPREKHDARSDAYYGEILERVQSLPGVRSAGLSSVVPLSGDEQQMGVFGPGRDRSYNVRRVSRDYFRTMGIRIVKGRSFSDTDTFQAPLVTIVNETLARQMWPGEDPIGKKLFGSVVGVVGDVRHKGLSIAPQPELFTDFRQDPISVFSTLAVRSDLSPAAMMPAIRASIREIEPDQPIEFATMEQLVADSVAQPRFYALLMGSFGMLALILTSAGIYGVVSYATGQRRHEIGVRVALGARSIDLLLNVIGYGARYVLLGIAIGLAGALAVTRFLSNLLFGVKPTDPASYAGAALILLACSLVAMVVPARRIIRADPLASLRSE